MSDYFDLSPAGDMTIVKSGRTVFTTAGRLVTGLPSGYDYVATATLTYSDFSNKGWLYNWRWTAILSGGGPNYACGEIGDGFVKVPKQTTTSTTTLAAAPSSLVNLFYPKIRINRTTAPSHTWLGNTINVKPKTNVWIPYTGSVLLEEVPGMSRAFTLRIDGSGNLVMHQQQSVSDGPFWASNNANVTMLYGDPGVNPSMSQTGGEWAIDFSGTLGLPVYQIDHTNPTYSAPGLTLVARRLKPDGTHPQGTIVGPNAASVTDPTNYRSIYSIEIAGKFGRAA